MKRNIRIASGIMFASLIGLLSFQVYWISSAYNQKKSNLESEIKEAFSRANNGLLIKKLGDFSGIDVRVTSEGGFYSPNANTVVIKKEFGKTRFLNDSALAGMMMHGDGRGSFSIDTVISEISSVVQDMTATLETSILVDDGDISEMDFEFMDSLLQAYLLPIHFETKYELSFGDVQNGEFEFTSGLHSFSPEEDKVKTLFQPISFAEGGKMARIVFPEKQLIRASLSEISLIILASVVMLGLLVSAWYYIVRSLQRQYELTQMKDDFISNMTHELKTPVTASSLALEVLAKNEKISEDQDLKGLIGVAMSEQERMLNMIDSILESTSQNLLGNEELEVLDLAEELEAVTETIRLKITEAGGQLTVDLPTAPLHVKGSQVHLQNAMINILENAIKYSPEAPQVTVHLSREGSHAQLQISDEGMGISKEDQKRIFEKFFRVSTGNVHTTKGYGLGLSYTQSVIEKLGGSIELDSEPGQGSTFTIKLPITHAS